MKDIVILRRHWWNVTWNETICRPWHWCNVSCNLTHFVTNAPAHSHANCAFQVMYGVIRDLLIFRTNTVQSTAIFSHFMLPFINFYAGSNMKMLPFIKLIRSKGVLNIGSIRPEVVTLSVSSLLWNIYIDNSWSRFVWNSPLTSYFFTYYSLSCWVFKKLFAILFFGFHPRFTLRKGSTQ